MDFSTAFEKFLQNVKQHDLEGLKNFLSPTAPIRILLPDGIPITTYDRFLESQKSFFENPEASFNYQIISTEESGDLGFGVCSANVKAPLEESIRSLKLQICFLFRKIEDQWILVFDQNSELKA